MNGPDQILPAESFTTIQPDGAVKLRTGSADPQNHKAISVPGLLIKTASAAPNHTALAVKRDGKWIKWSYAHYLKETKTVAKAFIKLGLQRHHSVGILGFNSPEWFISDLGAVFAGGIATGIYPTNSPEACKYIAENCRADILVVEDEKQLEKILSIKDQLTGLKAIVQYLGSPTNENVLSWKQLLEIGEKEDEAELENRLKMVAINQCCHLVYTSGTTGMPKGVMLSHDNLTHTALLLSETYHLRDREERLVSYLPLSHVAANILDIFVVMTAQSATYFADKNALKGTLVDTLKDAQPTFFFGVPRVWEKIQERMLAIGRANKGLKQTIGTWAKKTGLEYNLSRLYGQNNASTLKYKIANKVVFSKVKTALGFGKCFRFFVAAAPITSETLEYFLSLDIRIMEIYGMSECTGPHIVNTYEEQRIGSIGKSMMGLETKIGPMEEIETGNHGGEILMRGRNVMMGYLYNEEKTTEVFTDDDFLRTGDLGIESEDGFFKVTGRIKELIITAGGENIAPVLIEETIKLELPCLSNVMLIGDRRKFLSCLMTFKTEVDQETLIPSSLLSPSALEWCTAIGSKAKTVEDIIGGCADKGASRPPDELIMLAIQEGIDRANSKALSNAQKVQKWIILSQDFSLPGGELGPTMKMKRHVVLQKHVDKVEKFYK